MLNAHSSGDDFLTLTPEGQWEVCITASWSANTSGVRSIRFFDIEAQDFGATSPAMPTGTTLQSTCGIVRANLGGATINLEAYQSSGSSLFVSGYATAIRIADL